MITNLKKYNFLQSLLLLSINLLIIVLLHGCSSENSITNKNLPEYGGTLKLKVIDTAENLDPAMILFLTDWTVASFIYEGLVGFDGIKNDVFPVLAQRWEKLDNGKRWIFHLNRNVYFHNDPCFPNGKGREFEAQDVVNTFERIARPETKSPNWYLFKGKIKGIDEFHRGESKSISGVKILDKYQVEFTLTNPYVSFLKILASPAACIVPLEAVEYYKDNFQLHPVGTGPFLIARWKPFEELFLTKNTKYWKVSEDGQTLPYLDAVRIIIDSNLAIALSELYKGELHVLSVSEKQYLDLITDIKFSENYKATKIYPPLSIRFLGFSLDTNSPFAQNIQLRQAIVKGFNKSNLTKNNNNHRFDIANTLVPPHIIESGLSGQNQYDEKTAKRIIKQFKNIKDFTLNLCSNINSMEMQLLKSDMERLGLNVKFKKNDLNYYQYIINNRPDIFRVSFAPSYPDAEEFYMLFYSKSGKQINLCGYKNPKYDLIMENVLIEQNSQKRKEMFSKLEKILLHDIPAIYLFHEKPNYIITPRSLHNIKIGFNNFYYCNTWMEK